MRSWRKFWAELLKEGILKKKEVHHKVFKE